MSAQATRRPSIILKCPKCGHTADAPPSIAGKQVRCRACNATFTASGGHGFELVEEKGTPPIPARVMRSNVKTFGWFLVVVGLVGALYFWSMDTSIEVKGSSRDGRRVHNIGLMQERQLGMICFTVAAAFGGALVAFGDRKK